MSEIEELLANILSEIKGLRADFEKARKDQDTWIEEQAALNKEANERGRRLELKHAQLQMEKQN